MMRRSNVWVGFLLGCIAMLTLQSTIILQPPHATSLSFSTASSLYSSSSSFATDCHGLAGMKVLLVEVHLEGNLGDEMETTPFLQELKRCDIHITAVLSRWLERPEQRIGSGSVREHALIDVIHRHASLDNLSMQDYQAVILAPGPWRLCLLQEHWPYHIDIFMSGSILPEQQMIQPGRGDCDLSKRFKSWNPSLVVVREPYSLGLLQEVQALEGVTTYMSGDLSNSFQPVNSTLNYWKGMYQKLDQRILIFARGSNAENVVLAKGWNIELTTLMNGNVSLPATKVIFATSSPLEDAAWMLEGQQNFAHMQEHQFVQCHTVEQLWALISQSTHVYTDRYHPGVVAHLFGKPVTVLEYKEEQSKLVGLAQLAASQKYSPVAIRNEYNAHAFQLLRDTLRRLKDRDPKTIRTYAKGDDDSPTKMEVDHTVDNEHVVVGEQPYAIVVGMPKSGTTSIYQFFTCSGYHTTHYCCCGSNATEYPCAGGKLFSQQLRDNLQEGRPLWQGTGDKFVHAQLDGESMTESYILPQHYNLKELDESAPRAVWILPLRPAAKWKHSVQKWLDLEERLRVVYQRNYPSAQTTNFDLETFYQNHTEMIRNFCRKHRQSPKLCVEVDIDDPEAGKHLAKHFQNAIPTCWGKHNTGPFFQGFSSQGVAINGQSK
jgi:hypothetical protein